MEELKVIVMEAVKRMLKEVEIGGGLCGGCSLMLAT